VFDIAKLLPRGPDIASFLAAWRKKPLKFTYTEKSLLVLQPIGTQYFYAKLFVDQSKLSTEENQLKKIFSASHLFLQISADKRAQGFFSK